MMDSNIIVQWEHSSVSVWHCDTVRECHTVGAQCLCGKKAIECFGRRGGGSFNRLADESQEPVKERKIIFLEEVIGQWHRLPICFNFWFDNQKQEQKNSDCETSLLWRSWRRSRCLRRRKISRLRSFVLIMVSFLVSAINIFTSSCHSERFLCLLYKDFYKLVTI